MGGFLIDTNAVSEFVRPDLGIEDLPVGKRRAALEQWLEEGVPEWFQANLLAVTKAIADRWGQMTIQAKRKGVTISTADGLIAATAIQHGLILVTRNIKSFLVASKSRSSILGKSDRFRASREFAIQSIKSYLDPGIRLKSVTRT